MVDRHGGVMRFFAREIPPAYGVVDESSHAARSEMLEFHLLHIYAGDADFLVALDDDSVSISPSDMVEQAP